MTDLFIREGVPDDAASIVQIEHSPSLCEYIGQWSRAEHLAAMADPDARYFILSSDASEVEGYAILRGLLSEHRSLELKRIALRNPGKGMGRHFLRTILRKAFQEFSAHKLWLDVFETNHRAQHLYRSLGFQTDGVFRDAEYRDGKFHSLLLMSMLEDEYRPDVPA